jgi:glutamyl-tRNA synthetase
MSDNKVVTRFAPSPTGFMHVGGVRTALYSWLWARKNNGQFILRIEDTDKEREVEGSVLHIQEALKWVGINWDQGPDIGGPHAPYTQSERLELYKKYANILIEKGFAYADPYSEEDLEKFRQEAEANKKPFLYREHRPENPPVWDGSMPLRFKIKDLKRSEWNDLVFGDLSAGPEALDDFILMKSDGYPTYNFCHIVDDIEMGVTHVIRGQEFISSTPKFLALYEALGIKPPLFVSLPHILGKDGHKKLGKRDGAKDVLDYKKEGYLPEAMINYLAFLGFNPGGEKEVYSVEELISVFDLSKIQHSGAKWNDEKLDWMNKEHMKLLSKGQIEKEIIERFPEEIQKDKITIQLVPLIFDKIYKWGDVKKVVDDFSYLFIRVGHSNQELPIWKDLKSHPDKFDKTLGYLKKILDLLEPVENWTYESIKNAVWNYANDNGKGNILWPMRFALSVSEKTPDPFKLAELLGKIETLDRIKKLINFLKDITKITLGSIDFLKDIPSDKVKNINKTESTTNETPRIINS